MLFLPFVKGCILSSGLAINFCCFIGQIKIFKFYFLFLALHEIKTKNFIFHKKICVIIFGKVNQLYRIQSTSCHIFTKTSQSSNKKKKIVHFTPFIRKSSK